MNLPADFLFAFLIEVAAIQGFRDLADGEEGPIVRAALSVHGSRPQIKEGIDLVLRYLGGGFDFGNRASASERQNQKKATRPIMA